MLAAGSSSADTSGIFLPAQPSGPGGQDQIESTTGARCSQSINSPGAYLDIGLAAHNDSDDRFFLSGQNNNRSNDRDIIITGYARMIMPLGETPKRIDCSRLYEIELERLQQEIKLLRMGVE